MEGSAVTPRSFRKVTIHAPVPPAGDIRARREITKVPSGTSRLGRAIETSGSFSIGAAEVDWFSNFCVWASATIKKPAATVANIPTITALHLRRIGNIDILRIFLKLVGLCDLWNMGFLNGSSTTSVGPRLNGIGVVPARRATATQEPVGIFGHAKIFVVRISSRSWIDPDRGVELKDSRTRANLRPRRTQRENEFNLPHMFIEILCNGD